MWKENYKLLQDFMNFWGSCKVHDSQTRGYWDQQKGALLSTSSVMALADKIVKEEKYQFFLPGRVLGDSIENFFSCVRRMEKNPSALLFKRTAKAICVTQYLRYSPNGSYEEDDSEEFLVDFEDFRSKEVDAVYEAEEDDLNGIDEGDIDILEKEDFDLEDFAELNALANITAAILAKTIRDGSSKCETCIDFFTTSFAPD